jgi:transcriptional regulatory protein LevR
MNSKGKEYSLSQADVNNNFKRLSAELNIKSEQILWIFLKKHLDAILNYINKGKVESESIDSRIGDAVNYLLILSSLIQDLKNEAQIKGGFEVFDVNGPSGGKVEKRY